MTWTYDPNLSTDKDKVRMLIGDTNVASQLLQNEAIDTFLNDGNGNIYRAAGLAAGAISSQFSNEQSVTIGPMSITAGERATAFNEKADMFLQMAERFGAGSLASPFVGGTSKAELEQWSPEDDSDFIGGDFSRGMHDNPGHDEDLEFIEEGS